MTAAAQLAPWHDFPRLGTCPVAPAAVVRVRFRNGQESRPAKASSWRWDRHPGQDAPDPWDVVAYRVEEGGA